MSENKIPTLIKGLKAAYDECWKAKIATNDVAKKYAPLCVQLVHEFGIPKLINGLMQERTRMMDGMSPFHEDFWADENMIIAFFEHLENEYGWEVANACV